MNQEISMIDKILDENNSDPIVLYDENNKETKFEQVAVIPLDEKLYVLLKPITKIAGVNDDEALVFKVSRGENGEDKFEIELDDEIIDAIFEEYNRLLDKMIKDSNPLD